VVALDRAKSGSFNSDPITRVGDGVAINCQMLRGAVTGMDCQVISQFSRRVLIIESDTVAGDAMVEHFNFHGMTAVRVENGGKALSIFSNFLPDIIIVDIGLEEAAGFANIAAMRNTPHGASAKFIGLVERNPHNAQQALATGFDRHIERPIVLDELIDAVG